MAWLHDQGRIGERVIRIKPIKVNNPFPTRAQWTKAINAGLDETAKYGIDKALKPTASTWTKQPDFEVLKETNFTRFIGTTNKIWVMLNEGTEAHEIRARNARRLAFMAGGTAKSTPNQLTSGAGSPGTTQVFAVVVHHPGTEPRKWDKAAAKKIQPVLVRNMQDALNDAIRKAK